MMFMTPKIATYGKKGSTPCGNKGTAILIRPYVPSFGKMPEQDRHGDGHLGRPRERTTRVRQRRYRELRPREYAEGQKAREHRRAPEKGVDKEPSRRPAPVLVPPYADEQVHRYQRDLEEDVEEDQILRCEHPEHPNLRDEEYREVLPEVLPNIPRRDHGDERQEGREEEHPEPQPVEPDPVANTQRRDPFEALREKRGTSQITAVHKVDVEREQERRRRDPKSGVANGPLVGAAQKEHQEDTDQRQENYYRRDHRRAPTATAAIATAAIRATTRNAYCAPTITPRISILTSMSSA